MTTPEISRPKRRLEVCFVSEHKTLAELSSTEAQDGQLSAIDAISQRYRDLLRAGDEVVAFVDYTTDEPESEGTLTVAEHVDHGPTEISKTTKIDRYLRGKNVEQLVEDGYYIGPCVVALSRSITDISKAPVRKVRLAIFKPFMTSASN